MKIISKCEKQFVSDCVTKKQKRIDGREFTQGRTLQIVFGEERGCCMVLQGKTLVLAQVTCEVTEPKKGSPNEGILLICYELSGMASPNALSIGRNSEEIIEVQRSLERCIRDSKCVEVESLCILSGSKAWTIQVDVHCLNDDGNIAECASICAISALAHFRRPQVTVSGTDIVIHPINEREPKPLNLIHLPITVTLALFEQGKHILFDPNEMEEKVCDGCYLMGVNAHQEFIYVHRRGVLLLKEETMIKCEDLVMTRVQELTQVIRKALDDDAYQRATNAPIGFPHLIQSGTILVAKHQVPESSLAALQNMPPEEDDIETTEHIENSDIGNELEHPPDGANTGTFHVRPEAEATVFEGGHSKWDSETDDEVSAKDNDELPETKPSVSTMKNEVNSDSEEETVYINKEQLDKKSCDKRGWFAKDAFA